MDREAKKSDIYGFTFSLLFILGMEGKQKNNHYLSFLRFPYSGMILAVPYEPWEIRDCL